MEEVTSESVNSRVKAAKGKKRQKVTVAKKVKVKKEVKAKIEAPKKWRQRGRRPLVVAPGCSAPPSLSTFSLFNSEVEYRVCGTIVMFKTENVLSLTKTALGLNTDVGKSSPVGAVLKHLRTASKYELLLQVKNNSNFC
jgi:hypothetical protein